ncbi:MAG: Gfo/Idh/MocA family oxidoreductase, partial [Ferruginibacter sp.]
GFWAGYQIPAWLELQSSVELVALYNREIGKARQYADQFAVPNVYDDADHLLEDHAHQLDFIDIITDVHTHPLFTFKGAEMGLAVITQKPMAPDLKTAKKMVEFCNTKNVKFFVHENFRWQAPLQKLKELIGQNKIGKPFKCRLSFLTAFPVFDNQPALRELDDMIIADLGSHTFDIARFLFGEVAHVYCQVNSITPGIKGEDVANALLTHVNGVQSFVEMSFATRHGSDAFPQTLAFVEGSEGSILLNKDYSITVISAMGMEQMEAPPLLYNWASPDYAVVHSSIVDCNRNILNDLLGKGKADTTGEDNYKTMQLVYAAYESARSNKVVFIKEMN